jgi:hypothetical protein
MSRLRLIAAKCLEADQLVKVGEGHTHVSLGYRLGKLDQCQVHDLQAPLPVGDLAGGTTGLS